MKTMEDSRSELDRNREARRYSRSKNVERWDKITRNCLFVSFVVFCVTVLVGWAAC